MRFCACWIRCSLRCPTRSDRGHSYTAMFVPDESCRGACLLMFLIVFTSSSLQVATPADWVPGKDVVVLGTVSTDDAIKMFPKGVKVVRPWLRTTPDPKAP
jgi:hypothetical protein